MLMISVNFIGLGLIADLIVTESCYWLVQPL